MDPMSIASELSTLGLVPVLLWMHLKAEKRQDRQEAKIEEQRKEADQRFEAMAKTWQRQLNEMVEKHDAKEEAVRDRYDAVVAKLDLEKKSQTDKTLEEVRALGLKVDDMVRFIARPMR